MKNLKALCFATLLGLSSLTSCISTDEQTQPPEHSPIISAAKAEIKATWHMPTTHKKPLLSRDYHSKPTGSLQKH